MPQRITPSKTIVTTKDGEVHVTLTLDLNINLNNSGVLQVSTTPNDVAVEVKKQEKEDEFHWAVPDFNSSNDFKFGKDV